MRDGVDRASSGAHPLTGRQGVTEAWPASFGTTTRSIGISRMRVGTTQISCWVNPFSYGASEGAATRGVLTGSPATDVPCVLSYALYCKCKTDSTRFFSELTCIVANGLHSHLLAWSYNTILLSSHQSQILNVRWHPPMRYISLSVRSVVETVSIERFSRTHRSDAHFRYAPCHWRASKRRTYSCSEWPGSRSSLRLSVRPLPRGDRNSVA